MKERNVRSPFLVSVLVVVVLACCFTSITPVVAATTRPTSSIQRQLIIGGHDAIPHRFPYYVSLDYHNGVVLSGALIAPDFVLTAGHCLENDTNKVTVRVGTYTLGIKNNNNNNVTTTTTMTDPVDVQGIVIPIRQAMRHPSFFEFQKECFTHDFLLFQLTQASSNLTSELPFAKINRNPHIPKPVTFATTDAKTSSSSSKSNSVMVEEDHDDDDDPNAIIMMGLGWTSALFSSPANTLQMAELYPISNRECEQTSHDEGGGLTYQGLLDSTMLCTKGGRNNTRDGCAWDSGDPVILPGSTPEEDIIVGLGSWGFGCASPNFPGVQARVSAAADWIDEMVCQYSVDPPPDFKCSTKKLSSSAKATTTTTTNTTATTSTTNPPKTTTSRPTTTPTIRKATTAPSIAPIQPTETPSVLNKYATASNGTLPRSDVDTTEPSSHDVENNDKDATSKASFSWRIFVLLIAIAAVIYVAALFIHRQRQRQQRSKNKFNDVSEVEGLLFHNNNNNNNNNYQNGNNIPSNDRGAPGYGSTAMQ